MQDSKDPAGRSAAEGTKKAGGTSKKSSDSSGAFWKEHFKSNRKYFTISVYVVVTFFICLIIYKVFGNWSATVSTFSSVVSTLMPFLVAFLIAYFINPMAGWIDDLIFYRHFNIFSKSARKARASAPVKKAHRLISVVLAYVIVIAAVMLALSLILPQVVEGIAALVSQLPSMVNTITGWIENLDDYVPGADLSYVENIVSQLGDKIVDYVQNFASELLPKLYNIGRSFLSAVLNVILAFIISCYISAESDSIKFQIKRIIYALFREEIAERIVYTLKKSNTIFSSFITGKVIDSIIIGMLCFLLMKVLRLDYAVVLSLIVGVTNMIPYFGPFIGAVPGVIILLVISPGKALIFVIMIVLLQQFDGNILGPKILGESTGLKPVWVIFAIIVGGAVAGPIGMFLGVPIVGVLVFIGSDLLNYILSRRNIRYDLSNIDPNRMSKIDHVFIYSDPPEDAAAAAAEKEAGKKPEDPGKA
ncbi:MAG: AI-2E family transporter [Lachnospiraceae bacterium]|nr:AI-2E family transporter [Lachnospiraceae bacterium]